MQYILSALEQKKRGHAYTLMRRLCMKSIKMCFRRIYGMR